MSHPYKKQAEKSMASKVKSHGGSMKAAPKRPDAPKGYAKGGRVGKKAGTHVNVIVAPGQGGNPVPPSMPGAMGAGAASMTPRPAVPPMSPPPGLAGLGGAPMPMRKRGGKVYKAGAGSGEGRLEKCEMYGSKAKVGK